MHRENLACLLPVHPHVCGENLYVAGSRIECDRFTPTCVGKM